MHLHYLRPALVLSNACAKGSGAKRCAAPETCEGNPSHVALAFTRTSPGSSSGSAEVVEAVFAGWKGAPPSKS
jgi:hypothetical protein